MITDRYLNETVWEYGVNVLAFRNPGELISQVTYVRQTITNETHVARVVPKVTRVQTTLSNESIF